MAKNLFKNAQVIETVTKEAKKKSDRVRVEIKGLKEMAYIDNLIDSLTSLKKSFEGQVKTKMLTEFKSHDTRPANFRGFDDDAEASCEMRRRSSASPLTAEEAAAFDKHGVPYDSEEIVPQMFVINKKYMDDEKLLERVSKALEKLTDFPEDFILLQQKSSKKIVTDETIDTIYEKKLKDQLLTLATTLGVKPSVEGLSSKKAMAYVKDLIG